MSGTGAKRAPAGDRALLKRGLAGGVRREVRPEERAALAALKPDPQTQAVLEALSTFTSSEPIPAPHVAAVAAAVESGASVQADASTPAPADTASSASRPVEFIPTSAIAPSPHQARRHFAGIDALARSIADTGLQHPILVRRNAADARSPYTLVFGERRHRAYLQLARDPEAAADRYDAIPAFVLEADELSDARLAVLTAEENAQRAGLTAWELAQNVVRLKAALDTGGDRPVRFDQLARHFNLQAGSTNEYYTIGTALPEAVLRDAGLVEGEEVDWERVAQLKKQRLLSIARKPAAERAALLRSYAGVERSSRRRGAGSRFTVERLRDEGGFAMKIEKPVSSASYSRTQSEHFLRDLEPALALLAEIAGDGGPVYHPDAPNLPGTYLVLRDRPDRLSPEERKQALDAVERLRRELTRR